MQRTLALAAVVALVLVLGVSGEMVVRPLPAEWTAARQPVVIEFDFEYDASYTYVFDVPTANITVTNITLSSNVVTMDNPSLGVSFLAPVEACGYGWGSTIYYALAVSPSGREYEIAFCTCPDADLPHVCYDLGFQEWAESGVWTVVILSISFEEWNYSGHKYYNAGQTTFTLESGNDLTAPACTHISETAPTGVFGTFPVVTVNYTCTDEQAGLAYVENWYRLAAWPLILTSLGDVPPNDDDIFDCETTGLCPMGFPLPGKWSRGKFLAVDDKMGNRFINSLPPNFQLFRLEDVVIEQDPTEEDLVAPVCVNFTVSGTGSDTEVQIDCEDNSDSLMSLVAHYKRDFFNDYDGADVVFETSFDFGEDDGGSFSFGFPHNWKDGSATFTLLGFVVSDETGNYAVYGDPSAIPAGLLRNEWETAHPDEGLPPPESSTGTDETSSGASSDSSSSGDGSGGDDDEGVGESAAAAVAVGAVPLLLAAAALIGTIAAPL